MEQESDASVQQLVDGFSALAVQYQFLAQQHELLDRKLALANAQVEELRRLLPSQETTLSTNPNDAKPILSTGRNLDDWLQRMTSSGDVKNEETSAIIHQAQLASFRLQNRSRATQTYRRRSIGGSPVLSRAQSRAPSHPTIPEEPMEQDFTEVRIPGKLGCPFASRAGGTDAAMSARASQGHSLPTPQGSGSYPLAIRRGSKRSSFADPLRPVIKPADPLSPAQSVEEYPGPACPIRFLGKHSPEEVAKYFDEHKHELPRSHEVCVKRFQDADSIREIDAKYGSLVTMIQGLGEKHQPMLPDVPSAEELSAEQEADQRVKKWAASVTEFELARSDLADLDQIATEQQNRDDKDEHERLPRFERSLKEVRLGESPSRPWGVPVPPTYLDQEDASDAGSTAVAHPDHMRGSQLASRANERGAMMPAMGDLPLSNDGPIRKCPFDHKALMDPASTSLKVVHGERRAAPDSLNMHPAPNSIKVEPSRTELAPRPTIINEVTQAESSKPELRAISKIINYGTAVVADSSQLPPGGFENRGVLIMGYDAQNASNLMAAAQGRGVT